MQIPIGLQPHPQLGDVFSSRASRHPVLFVDADAVASGLIALEQFQSVSRWNSQIFQSAGRVDARSRILREFRESPRQSRPW
jgi:hypothetical protein